MSGFINYERMDELDRLAQTGFFKDPTISRFNKRSMSELERLVQAMDEKEIYIVIRAIIDHHREMLVKTLEYLEKEGTSK